MPFACLCFCGRARPMLLLAPLPATTLAHIQLWPLSQTGLLIWAQAGPAPGEMSGRWPPAVTHPDILDLPWRWRSLNVDNYVISVFHGLLSCCCQSLAHTLLSKQLLPHSLRFHHSDHVEGPVMQCFEEVAFGTWGKKCVPD